MLDGVNPVIFDQMLSEGELPAIERYFVNRGLYAPRAVANLPSVTLANEVSLVTGAYPGHHGVTGINWFDRNQLIWRDYNTIAQKNMLDQDYRWPTIFEYFPGRTTLSLFYQAHRGVTKFMEGRLSAGPPYFFRWYEFVDRITLNRFRVLIELAKQRGGFPAMTYVYLLAPDYRAYESGVHSAAYRDAMRHTDQQLGRVLADLEESGWLDRIYLALVSDHSLTQVERHFDLAGFVADDLGLKVAKRTLWEQNPVREIG